MTETRLDQLCEGHAAVHARAADRALAAHVPAGRLQQNDDKGGRIGRAGLAAFEAVDRPRRARPAADRLPVDEKGLRVGAVD